MALKQLTQAERFAPKWSKIEDPSENELNVPGTRAQRIFSPVTGVGLDNPYSGEAEVVLAGYEGGRDGFQGGSVSIKTYQIDTDRYSRDYIPPELGFRTGVVDQLSRNLNQGLGSGGGLIAVAGGTAGADASSNRGRNLSKVVYVMDAQTKAVDALPPMNEPRAYPLVTVSPDGRYVLVAGGYGGGDQSNTPIDTKKIVEVYDRKEEVWIDVASRFPGLERLPTPRFGGTAVWLQDKGVDRIFFVGGSDEWRGAESSRPTRRVDVYDACACDWLETELTTPRMFPGVAIRELDHGCKQVVVAGGGTGDTSRPTTRDPQIYSSELFDPVSLDRSHGQHLPVQLAVPTRTDSGAAMEWSPTALVFKTARPSAHPKGCDAVTQAFYFGFSKAFGAPLDRAPLEDGHQQV